jgi:hypothetical protein
MLGFLACGPLVLILGAWVKLILARRSLWPGVVALIALCIVSANSAFSAGSFLYYHFRPPLPSLPPWQDPEVLNLVLLFVLAPIGMIAGVSLLTGTHRNG